MSAPINVKFGMGGRSEKQIFGPLSKNNTGIAALRAGLPVITSSTYSEIKSTSFDSFILPSELSRELRILKILCTVPAT